MNEDAFDVHNFSHFIQITNENSMKELAISNQFDSIKRKINEYGQNAKKNEQTAIDLISLIEEEYKIYQKLLYQLQTENESNAEEDSSDGSNEESDNLTLISQLEETLKQLYIEKERLSLQT